MLSSYKLPENPLSIFFWVLQTRPFKMEKRYMDSPIDLLRFVYLLNYHLKFHSHQHTFVHHKGMADYFEQKISALLQMQTAHLKSIKVSQDYRGSWKQSQEYNLAKFYSIRRTWTASVSVLKQLRVPINMKIRQIWKNLWISRAWMRIQYSIPIRIKEYSPST